MNEDPQPPRKLSVSDHSRDAAQLTYVYPVVSRRAGGVSVGVNLNPNNACNWACVYCQVPDLVRGSAPTLDLALLETELRGFLAQVTTDAWMEANAPPEARRLNDIAFSGNGEPTTSPQFAEAVELTARLRRELGVRQPKTVLITNGSQLHRPDGVRGLEALSAAEGEVWFKIDAATPERHAEINGVPLVEDRLRRNLRASAAACRTLVQTCVFARDGAPPTDLEQAAYVELLRSEVERGTPLQGVLLYGLARPSLQPGAERLARLDVAWIDAFADRIRAATALEVSAHA